MYDAIIVGARCAGAPTAMLLARKGYRVLLVDRATFPSDTISTHIIWPHGAEIMDRWGLLDRLAATGCPPIALNLIFDVGPFALKGAVTDTNGGRGGFCPRRTVLDKLLVDAAIEAGTELREGFTVEALLWDGDRVAGIKGHSQPGGTIEERAPIVVGADGVYSLVAKAVQASEYDVKPPLTTNYYSYYSGFEADDIEQYVRDYQAVGCFPTHDSLTLIAVLWPSSRFEEIRTDIEGHVRKVLESTPSVADRLQGAHREEKWFGTAGVPNYFRQPFGPGWALVGDAGYDKDPITAQGISDAFIDAEALTTALDDGWCERRPLADALAWYQSSRDRRAKPMYEFTCQMATLQPPPPQMQQLFAALRGNQDATNQFYSAMTGSSPLPAFMNPENLARIIERRKSRVTVERREVMYLIREVLNCKPGKVRHMVEKFRGISIVLTEMGQEPLRVLTDVTGEPFWTIVVEARVEKIEDFFAIEQSLMANETLRKTMADYHDLIDRGRREIYRIES